ncbi:MAG: hypothetical protein ACWA5W_10200 [Phycisphaerales bacterium]
MTNKIRPCVALGTLLALCGVSQANPFVFQGSLNDQGAPATGVYDLEFALYSVDIGGTQVGPTVTLEDQQVTDGRFSVEIDFGDVFDGSSKWIEVSVRNGDSVDPFTELSPRAKVGSTPQASFADHAGLADALVDPTWNEAPGVISYGIGQSQVVINRATVWEPTDVLLVHHAVNGPTGMNVSGGAQSLPYYGYTTASQMRAYTYYDPITDGWMVYKNGDQLEINSDNDVVVTNNLIVGGTITSLSDQGATNQFESHTPDTIFAGFGYDRVFNSFAGAVVSQGSNQYLRTNLELPNGATVVNIHIEFVDRASSTNLSVQLWKRSLTTLAFTTETLGVSSGSDANNVQVMSIDPNPALVIDNTTYTYALRAFSTSGTWPTVGNLGIRSILIEYSMP